MVGHLAALEQHVERDHGGAGLEDPPVDEGEVRQVGAAQRHLVAGLDALAHQEAGDHVGDHVDLGVRHPPAGGREDDGLALGVVRRAVLEQGGEVVGGHAAHVAGVTLRTGRGARRRPGPAGRRRSRARGRRGCRARVLAGRRGRPRDASTDTAGARGRPDRGRGCGTEYRTSHACVADRLEDAGSGRRARTARCRTRDHSRGRSSSVGAHRAAAAPAWSRRPRSGRRRGSPSTSSTRRSEDCHSGRLRGSTR